MCNSVHSDRGGEGSGLENEEAENETLKGKWDEERADLEGTEVGKEGQIKQQVKDLSGQC